MQKANHKGGGFRLPYRFPDMADQSKPYDWLPGFDQSFKHIQPKLGLGRRTCLGYKVLELCKSVIS
jgi:hypothetical protein